MRALRSLIVLTLIAELVMGADPASASTPIASDNVLSFLANPPAIEYGPPGELRGTTRVFIYTDLQVKERENIVANIRKKLPMMIFTDRPEDADAYLVFRSVEVEVLSGIEEATQVEVRKKSSGESVKKRTTTTTVARPIYQKLIYGEGFVFKRETEGRVRLLIEFSDKQKSFFERKPSTNFARAFVKALQAANKGW